MVSGFAGTLKKILSQTRGSVEKLSQQLEKNLEQNKEAIRDALSKLHSPIIVVIDDVDRLTPPEIKQLFQLIKAVADFPKTIYLLAYEPLLVEKALESFHVGSETSYIEKIVQLSFDVPNPTQSQIVSVLWNGLEIIIKAIPEHEYEQGRWNEFRFGTLPLLFRNIRDVKRYLNIVNFKFPIIEGEVNAMDLLIIEAMNLFAPSLYRAIRNNKDLVTADSPRARFRREDKERTEWIINLPDLAPERFRKEMKELLTILFPGMDSVFRGQGWAKRLDDTLHKHQRICLSAYFDYYFQGSLSDGEISAKEANRIIELLKDQKGLAGALTPYLIDGRLTKLLYKLENTIEDSLDENIVKNLTISLFEVAEEIPVKPHAILDFPLHWHLRNTIYRLLRKLPIKTRKELLINAMESATEAWDEWQSSEGSQVSEREKWLTQDEVGEVKNAALALLRKHKNTDVLYKTPKILLVLSSWERWSNNEEVSEWVENVLSDEKKLPDFLARCGGFVGSSALGSHYSTHTFKIRPENLQRWCDIGRLKAKCEQVLADKPDWLTETDRPVVEAYVKGFGKNDDWDE